MRINRTNFIEKYSIGSDNSIKKILVIKLCCLGDIVFITPAIYALREKYPQAKITMLISRWVKELAECIPVVDNFIFFNAPYEGNILTKLVQTGQLLITLKKRKFDIAFIGHRNKIFGVLAFLAGIPNRIGFSGTSFLTFSVPFQYDQYEPERYLSILGFPGDENIWSSGKIVPRTDVFQKVESLLSEKGEISTLIRYLAIFPGGGENPGTRMPIKRWLPERYGLLIRELRRVINATILLLGNDSDKPICDEIIGNSGNQEKIINLAGKTSLTELIAILSKCTLFIGGDTGPLHIASALGIPTVSIFGPSDPRLVAPKGKLHRWVWLHSACSPCYTPLTVMEKKRFKGKDFICPTGTFECMVNLEVSSVMEAIDSVLNEIKKS